jgi:hypothetical protein
MNDSAVFVRQVRNDLRKGNLTILFLFWAFSGDENVASSPHSPQL